MEALQDVPPGYDPVMEAPKAKSKSAKRNERKKEKRLQVKFMSSIIILFQVVYNAMYKMNRVV